MIRLNRRHAARRRRGASIPQFEERLLTFTERIGADPDDPFLELLADDTLRRRAAGRAARRSRKSAVDFQFLFGRGRWPHWC